MSSAQWITDRLPELKIAPNNAFMLSDPVIAVNRFHGIMIVNRVGIAGQAEEDYFWQETPYRRVYMSDEIAGWMPLDVLPPLPPADYRPSNGSVFPEESVEDERRSY